jgi:cytochrome b561
MAQVSRYHPLLVALHWALAVLTIAALALGALVLAKIPNTDPMKLEALRGHVTGGLLILVLMLVRLLVRARTAHPPAASTGSRALDRLAWASHRLLYGVVLGMTASGAFLALQSGAAAVAFGYEGALPSDFWAYPMRSVHYVLSRALMALIALHVAGAFYHALILRDGLLRRMFFGRRVIVHASDRAHRRVGAFMSIGQLGPWLSRFVISAVATLFALISFKFVLDPQHAAATSGIMLDQAVGYTNTRAGFGGFPLAFAVILVFCLFSPRRHLAPLASIAIIAAVVLAVRLYGAAVDGTFGESLHLLIPETVMLAAAVLGALLEMRRRAGKPNADRGARSAERSARSLLGERVEGLVESVE